MVHLHHHHRRAAEPAELLKRAPVDFFQGAEAIASAFANPFGDPTADPVASTQPTSTVKKAAKTVFQTVYYTQSPTFTGPVSYLTLTSQPATQAAATTQAPPSSAQFDSQAAASSQQAAQQSQQSQQAQNTQSNQQSQQTQASQSAQPTGQTDQQSQTTDGSIPITTTTSTGPPVTLTSAPALSSSSVTSSSSSAGGAEIVGNGGAPSTSLPSSTSSAALLDPTDTSQGMTSGAKAGIAFVVILGIAGIAAVIAYFILKKKRKEREAYQRTADEKSGMARAASVTTPRAPRLSLRPLTQFAPSFGNRKSGNLLGGAAAAAAAGAAAGFAMKEKPINAATGGHNPFGDHAVTSSAPSSNRPSGAGVFKINAGHDDGPDNPMGTPPYVPSPIDSAAVPVPVPESLDTQMTPTGTHFEGMNAASDANAMSPSDIVPIVAGVGAGGAAAAMIPHPAAVPVHRVQLDFKPSMADELELQTGQLVRLVKEYDDGWVSDASTSIFKLAWNANRFYQALCSRLSSAEQGVCPRTCLSTRPVKPRPPPGPINTNMNMGARGPPGQMRGPGAPYSQRSASPASSRNSPMYPPGRPMTPNGRQSPGGMSPVGRGPRPASPANSYRPMPGPRPSSPAGSQGRDRSPSASVNSAGWSKPGPSRMNPGNPSGGSGPTPLPAAASQAPPRAVARKPIGGGPSGPNSPENPSPLANGGS